VAAGGLGSLAAWAGEQVLIYRLFNVIDWACLGLFEHKCTENLLFLASIGITEDPGINWRWDYMFIS
jgi:hypothetical protein